MVGRFDSSVKDARDGSQDRLQEEFTLNAKSVRLTEQLYRIGRASATVK